MLHEKLRIHLKKTEIVSILLSSLSHRATRRVTHTNFYLFEGIPPVHVVATSTIKHSREASCTCWLCPPKN